MEKTTNQTHDGDYDRSVKVGQGERPSMQGEIMQKGFKLTVGLETAHRPTQAGESTAHRSKNASLSGGKMLED